jgi:hypothetical protein
LGDPAAVLLKTRLRVEVSRVACSVFLISGRASSSLPLTTRIAMSRCTAPMSSDSASGTETGTAEHPSTSAQSEAVGLQHPNAAAGTEGWKPAHRQTGTVARRRGDGRPGSPISVNHRSKSLDSTERGALTTKNGRTYATTAHMVQSVTHCRDATSRITSTQLIDIRIPFKGIREIASYGRCPKYRSGPPTASLRDLKLQSVGI